MRIFSDFPSKDYSYAHAAAAVEPRKLLLPINVALFSNFLHHSLLHAIYVRRRNKVWWLNMENYEVIQRQRKNLIQKLHVWFIWILNHGIPMCYIGLDTNSYKRVIFGTKELNQVSFYFLCFNLSVALDWEL